MTTIHAEATEEAPVVPAAPAERTMPKAASRRDGVAPLKGNAARTLHQVLFIAGAVLLPGGLIVIGLGWYGVAHTPYEYNQNAYIVSGGLLGLGITFAGGFLYFGSWLARIAADQRESSDKLSETLILLAEAQKSKIVAEPEAAASVVAPAASATATVTRPVASPARAKEPAAVETTDVIAAAPAASAAPAATDVELVVAGRGKTVHRADCDLVAGRDDLKPAGNDISDLIPCRLCQS